MKPAALVFIVFLLLSPEGGADPLRPAASEDEFVAGLEQTRRLMANGRWSTAAQQLNALLAEHRGQSYAYARRSEIVECIKDCMFWQSYRPPAPMRLVSGNLLGYRESSGDIRITYAASRTGDFMVSRVKGTSGSRGLTLIHPAVFDGPYTITVEGKDYPALSDGLQPTVLVDLGDDAGYSVIFGFKAEKGGRDQKWLPAQIGRWEGSAYRELTKIDSVPCETGADFVFEVKVSEKEIAAYCDDKLVMKADKVKEGWGRIGLREMPFDEITVEGRIQTSWIQGMLDAAMHAARATFDRNFDPAWIPDWLRQERKGQVARTLQKDREYPGPDLPGQTTYISRAFDFYNAGKFREGLNYAMEIPEGKVTEAAREFILASFFMALGEHAKAFDCCSRVCRLDPVFYESRFMRAYLLAALGHDEKAIKEYRALLLESPRDTRIHPDLARLLLMAGRPEEAKTIVDAAIRKGFDSKDLKTIDRLLVKALRGPAWERVYEHRSQHYRVMSDIDQKTCREAAQILEESYSAYTSYLQWIKDLEKRKFRVYIFSGEAGYRAYLEGIETDIAFESAGLYIPTLKQLLIWNLPDRDMMMRVVRHEGFHQYLDRLMDTPPLWFNEGLAEYYERAERDKGKWTFGQIHTDHVRMLKGTDARLMPLEVFVRLKPGEFKSNPKLCYAQSWAFIHFLRHSTAANARIFDQLFKSLQGDVPPEDVIEKVFGRIDLEKLQSEFVAYIQALGGR
jgi:tetratricopeptide (TPR) repeat protein